MGLTPALRDNSFCFSFSKIETESDRTLFFLFRSLTSLSCARSLVLTMFNSRFRNSFSTFLGSRSISEVSFLDFFLLFGCSEVLLGVNGVALGFIAEDPCAVKGPGREIVTMVEAIADEHTGEGKILGDATVEGSATDEDNGDNTNESVDGATETKAEEAAGGQGSIKGRFFLEHT